MNDFIQTVYNLINLSQQNMHFLLSFIGLLWGIQIVNAGLGYRLNVLGIYPRHPLGLIGIPFSPFLHGNFTHLFFNSIPLFILANFVLLSGIPQFVCVSLIIIVISGVGTWVFARKGLHVGASGLIMGYFGYLLANAYYQPSIISVILGIVCLYYFGSMLFGLVPTRERVSWEGHLFGFLGGFAAIYLSPLLLARLY